VLRAIVFGLFWGGDVHAAVVFGLLVVLADGWMWRPLMQQRREVTMRESWRRHDLLFSFLELM
jgi:hypothetical protein